LARAAIERGADLILAAGGDGTINEVVNGMVHSTVPLGILPAGTANVLANELGIGKTMLQAAESLESCVKERIALGLLGGDAGRNARYFLMMAGVGLDAAIVYDLNLGLKEKIGKAAYWISGFSKLGRRLPEFTVVIDGKVSRVSFALLSRVRNYGGDLSIAPTISLLDDEFEVVLFEGSSSFQYLKYMIGVVARRLQGMRGVTILRACDAVFSVPQDPRIHVQLDGEYAGELPARFEIVPDALTLLVPPAFRTSSMRRSEQAQWTISPTR
jgi:YegS/Rv2252/BmrU family lipid kinase